MTYMRRRRLAPMWVTVALVVIGVILVVIGIIYATSTAGNLPGFLPGHIAGSARHHSKRGIVAIVVGVLCFIAAGLTRLRRRRTRW